MSAGASDCNVSLTPCLEISVSRETQLVCSTVLGLQTLGLKPGGGLEEVPRVRQSGRGEAVTTCVCGCVRAVMEALCTFSHLVVKYTFELGLLPLAFFGCRNILRV